MRIPNPAPSRPDPATFIVDDVSADKNRLSARRESETMPSRRRVPGMRSRSQGTNGMDVIRWLVRLPWLLATAIWRFLSALARETGWVLGRIFGRMSWQAPPWVIASAGTTRSFAGGVRRRPVLSAGVVVAALAVGLGTWQGFDGGADFGGRGRSADHARRARSIFYGRTVGRCASAHKNGQCQCGQTPPGRWADGTARVYFLGHFNEPFQI